MSLLTRDVSRDLSKGHWLPRVMIGELFAAFLTLAVASLTWGIIVGEATSDSIRPYAAGVFATMILSIRSVQMVAGLCYLVLDFYSKPDEGYDPKAEPATDDDQRSTDGGLIATCRTGYTLVFRVRDVQYCSHIPGRSTKRALLSSILSESCLVPLSHCRR
jgi:hypothetical protein